MVWTWEALLFARSSSAWSSPSNLRLSARRSASLSRLSCVDAGRDTAPTPALSPFMSCGLPENGAGGGGGLWAHSGTDKFLQTRRVSVQRKSPPPPTKMQRLPLHEDDLQIRVEPAATMHLFRPSTPGPLVASAWPDSGIFKLKRQHLEIN